MSTGGIQSAGAPGIPEPAAGTKTAFLSSVKLTHCSTKLCSLSTSCSFLSVEKIIKITYSYTPSLDIAFHSDKMDTKPKNIKFH